MFYGCEAGECAPRPHTLPCGGVTPWWRASSTFLTTRGLGWPIPGAPWYGGELPPRHRLQRAHHSRPSPQVALASVFVANSTSSNPSLFKPCGE
ncbi:hypothetical protein B566_EDAN003965 [Ephemera danica]|nr:hypothetical protein B566_EDAN003965 [Ephemera danica]